MKVGRSLIEQSVKVAVLMGAIGLELPWPCQAQAGQPSPLLPGVLRREVFENIPGLQLAQLEADPRFPGQPDHVDSVSEFETPYQWGENFGARLWGFLIPPETGDYVLYLASDDEGALYLSPDADPAKKRVIATEPAWSMPREWIGRDPDQADAKRSVPLRLQAEAWYYVEARMKEAGGGDHLGVTWQRPGESAPGNGAPPIPGAYLATYADPVRTNWLGRITITAPVEGAEFIAPAQILVKATAVDPLSYLYRVEVYDGERLVGVSAMIPIRAPNPGEPMHHTVRWTNVTAGTYELTARSTDGWGRPIVSAPVRVTVRPSGVTRELHVVGVYKGAIDTAGSNHPEGLAAVHVNRPGKRVTLVLSAYEPVQWQIAQGPNTVVEKVILAGYYRQRVVGLPAGVEVVPAWYEGGTGQYFLVGESLDSGQFYRSVVQIHALTGLEIASFHGTYEAPYPDAIVIDEVQNDPRLLSNYPQPIPPASVPNLGFQVAFYREGGPAAAGNILVRDYLLTGPTDSCALLPAVRAVPDGYRPLYYASGWHAVWRIDGPSGAVVDLDPDPDLPELSWPMGVAFDRERDRMLLVSLGGEGFLYRYAPDTREWGLVTSMDQLDLDCLEYHDADDSLYGLRVTHSDWERPVIYRFSATGVRLGEITLPVQSFDIMPGAYGSELVSMGDYLVLLLEPNLGWASGDRSRESRMYLIDPRTGEHWLTYRRIGPGQNQPPSVRLTSPVHGATPIAGQPLSLVASVHDPDGEVTSVEFLANGPTIGWGVRLSGHDAFGFCWPDPPAGLITLVARATDSDGGVSISSPITINCHEVSNGFVVRQLPPMALPGTSLTVTLQVEPSAATASWALEDRPPLSWLVGAISDAGVFDAVNGKVKFGPFDGAAARTLTYSVTPPPEAIGVAEFSGVASQDGLSTPILGDDRLVIGAHHPADRQPADWRMAINEVTAYGAAWRRGEPWPGPPSPIPVDYVTRTAALWTGGEAYTIDPQLGGPPLWWVNVGPVLRPEPMAADEEPSAVRRLAPGYVPGEALDVSIDVSAGSNTSAYAVEDQIPVGWTAAAVSHAGEFDARSRAIRWGPFLDQQRRTLSYRVRPPVTAEGWATFRGTASFDGHGLHVAGSSGVRLAERLRAERSSSGAGLIIWLSGQTGLRYSVEVSSDLVLWTRLGVLTNSCGTVPFSDLVGTTSERRFYRAVRFD